MVFGNPCVKSTHKKDGKLSKNRKVEKVTTGANYRLPNYLVKKNAKKRPKMNEC